jgi:predicted DNA-binding protein (UPF0251 family)
VSALDVVLEVARRHAGELLEQASAYQHKYSSPAIAKETMDEHYTPLSEAIEALEEDALTPREIDALLWAVRNVDYEALKQAQARRRFGDGTGYGALSSATNKIERALGRTLAEEEVNGG